MRTGMLAKQGRVVLAHHEEDPPDAKAGPTAAAEAKKQHGDPRHKGHCCGRGVVGKLLQVVVDIVEIAVVQHYGAHNYRSHSQQRNCHIDSAQDGLDDSQSARHTFLSGSASFGFAQLALYWLYNATLSGPSMTQVGAPIPASHVQCRGLNEHTCQRSLFR